MAFGMSVRHHVYVADRSVLPAVPRLAGHPRGLDVRIKLCVLALLVTWSTLSCGDSPTQPAPEPPGPPIDSKIIVTPSELLADAGRALILNCRTERIYPCANYRIAFDLTRSGSSILVRFRYIDLGTACATAIGPATCTLDLGALDPGDYSVEFRVGTGVTRVDLVVDAGAYRVTPDAGESVTFSLATLRRIPDETIWGLIGYLGVAPEPYHTLGQSFIDSLEAHGAEAVTLEPGEYGAFQIDPSGQMIWPGIHGYYAARPYVLHYAGPSEGVAEVIEQFGMTQSQWLSIRLYTWRGEWYATWLAVPG